MQATPPITTGKKNQRFLHSLDPKTREAIVENIAAHYRISTTEVLTEIYHDDAECILEYVTGKTQVAASLLMKRFTPTADLYDRHQDAVNHINHKANASSAASNVSIGFARLSAVVPRVKRSVLLYMEVHRGLNAVTDGAKILDAAIEALGSMTEDDYKEWVMQQQFFLSPSPAICTDTNPK